MPSCATTPRTAPLVRTPSRELQRTRSGPPRRLSCPPPRAASADHLGGGSGPSGGDRWDEFHAELQRAIASARARESSLRTRAPSPQPDELSGRPPFVDEAPPPAGLSPLCDSWDLDDFSTADLSIPWPSNLPAGEPGGRPEPLEFFPTSRVELDWGGGGEWGRAAPGGAAGAAPCPARRSIYVILFGVGAGDTEGIYSLRASSLDDGLPFDTVVAFETEDDAQRYACLLEASMDHVPSVWPIEWGELLDFCNAAGYRCRLEPAGSLLIPPDYNVGLTDWERTLRLRQGDWAVLDAEPERRPEAPAAELEQQQQHGVPPAFGPCGATPDWQTLMAAARAREAAEEAAASAAATPPAGAEAANAVELTDAQLAELKQRLEALLPRD